MASICGGWTCPKLGLLVIVSKGLKRGQGLYFTINEPKLQLALATFSIVRRDILDACLGLPPLGSQPEDHAAFGPAPPSIEDEVDGSRPAVPKPHVLDAFNTSWAHPQLKFEPKEEVAEDTPVLEPPASRLTIKSEDDGDGATTAEPLPAAAAATLEPMTAAATLELAAAATSTAEPVPAAAATAEPVPSPPTAPADETAGRRAKLQGHARPPLVPPHCPGCKLLGVFKGTHVIIGANGELPKSKVGAKSKRVAIDGAQGICCMRFAVI